MVDRRGFLKTLVALCGSVYVPQIVTARTDIKLIVPDDIADNQVRVMYAHDYLYDRFVMRMDTIVRGEQFIADYHVQKIGMESYVSEARAIMETRLKGYLAEKYGEIPVSEMYAPNIPSSARFDEKVGIYLV